jgi:hypothetical protein
MRIKYIVLFFAILYIFGIWIVPFNHIEFNIGWFIFNLLLCCLHISAEKEDGITT